MQIDHLVLWVDDPLPAVDFVQTVLHLKSVGVGDYRAGKKLFPSVRLSEDAILDPMPKTAAPLLNGIGARISESLSRSAGHRVHHLCLAMRSPRSKRFASAFERGASPW